MPNIVSKQSIRYNPVVKNRKITGFSHKSSRFIGHVVTEFD